MSPITRAAHRVVQHLTESYPELEVFKRGLFAVNPLANEEMFAHIGEWACFKEQGPHKGMVSTLPVKIVHLQKDYRGQVVYRGENQANRFGMPLQPEEIEFITVDQARAQWEANHDKVYEPSPDSDFDPDFDA